MLVKGGFDPEVNGRRPGGHRQRRGLSRRALMLACGGLVAVLIAGLPVVVWGRSDGTANAAHWHAASPPLGIREVLKAQSEALLRGDEQGWMAAVDPAAPWAVALYRQWFASLRALHVTGWDVQVDLLSDPPSSSPGPKHFAAKVAYCLATPSCQASSERRYNAAQMSLGLDVVLRDGRELIWSVENPPRSSGQPPPWEPAKLAVAEGRRVIVAAAPSQAGRLGEVVAAGDRAAAAVDRFAVWGTPPQRYIIFLAGPGEWRVWFGGNGGTALGYAQPLGLAQQVVLNMDGMAKSTLPLDIVVKHELGHVVTLTGTVRGLATSSTPWLEEGIAEYIAYKDTAWARYPRSAAVHEWINAHGWTGIKSLPRGKPQELGPFESDAFYGAAHLVVRCLVAKYGEPAMLEFFDAVVRQEEGPDVGARETFGKSWATVDRGCASFVRSA